MPELPDVTVYCEVLQSRFAGQMLQSVRVKSPFVVRTFDPPISELSEKRLLRTARIGKRIALEFEDHMWCVVHLMIAGRFKLTEFGASVPAKVGLLALDFESHSLLLTEAGSKKRASVHIFRTESEARQLDRGGIDVFAATFAQFSAKLRSENRTLKRALADPRLLSGIGNAYSDEILFWAELSPVLLTQGLSDEQLQRLYVATRQTLDAWTKRLRAEAQQGFPAKVTAFRPEMAVHGKFGQPCGQCGTKIQRIVYAHNETNYCPRCQTAGKLLADRALSRLLKKDWPRSIDELEELNFSQPSIAPRDGAAAREKRPGPTNPAWEARGGAFDDNG